MFLEFGEKSHKEIIFECKNKPVVYTRFISVLLHIYIVITAYIYIYIVVRVYNKYY